MDLGALDGVCSPSYLVLVKGCPGLASRDTQYVSSWWYSL